MINLPDNNFLNLKLEGNQFFKGITVNYQYGITYIQLEKKIIVKLNNYNVNKKLFIIINQIK